MTRIMRLFIDLEERRFSSGNGFTSNLPTLILKRGDVVPVELRFLRNGSPALLDPAAEIQLGFRAEGADYGDRVAAALEFTAPGDVATGYYTGTLSINTEEADAALGFGTENEEDSVRVFGEVTWSEDAGANWTSTENRVATLYNDVNRTDEGTPTEKPNASDWLDDQNANRGIQPIRTDGGNGHLFPMGAGLSGEILGVGDVAIALESMAYQSTDGSGFPSYAVTTAETVGLNLYYVGGIWEMEVDFGGDPATATYQSAATTKADPTGIVLSSSGRSDVTVVNAAGVVAPEVGDRGMINGVEYVWDGGSWRVSGLQVVEQTISDEEKEQMAKNWPEAGDRSVRPLKSVSRFALDNGRKRPIEILSQADHLYLMDEASGGLVDVMGGLDLVENETIDAAAVDADFGSSRGFDDVSRHFGASATNLTRNGGPFWTVFAIKFDSLTATQGIWCESNSSSDRSITCYMVNATMYVRVVRKDTSDNFDRVELSGFQAGTPYLVVFRADGTNLYLEATGLSPAEEDNTLELKETNYPLKVGTGEISGTVESNFFDGDLGLFAYGKGQLSEREAYWLTQSTAEDLDELRARIEVERSRIYRLGAVGDSTTGTNYVYPSWPTRAAALVPGWSADVHGVGGQTSSLIRDRLLGYHPDNIRRGVFAIFAGNNNAAQRQVVIDDVKVMVDHLLVIGVEKVLILGLPNRTGYSSTQQEMDDARAHQAFCDEGFAKIAASDTRVEFLDVHDHFVNPANYTPIDSDDVADQAAGIIPRSVRDDPDSGTSTHFSAIGADHIAALVAPYLILS